MLAKFKLYYFIGIGGIGMSALARYLKFKGYPVSGYDRTRTGLTDELTSEGIHVHYEDNVELIKSKLYPQHETLVIYTPAIPTDHMEMNYFKQNGFAMKKRAEVLGMITNGKFTIAVSGTHGKTSVSSMITHLLVNAGCNCTALLGGIAGNYNSNFITTPIAIGEQKEEIMVVEADEYDRSFLSLSPDIALITAIDPDHLDIYGTEEKMVDAYRSFAGKVKNNGNLIINKAIRNKIGSINNRQKTVRNLTYSAQSNADFYASGISVKRNCFNFNFHSLNSVSDEITLNVPGRHNIENAIAASAVASLVGVNEKQIKNALETFTGVKRRFEYHLRDENAILIDDYAHHPVELTAFITAVKEVYPDKKITGIFQPHLYTRTRDFAAGFAQALDQLSYVYLLDIYPARELPIAGVTSKLILDKMTIKHKQICGKKELISELAVRKPEVLLTIGAGDIDTMIPDLKRVLLLVRS